MSTKRSSIKGGGTRVTTTYSNGTSTDRDYNSHGKLERITDHERSGKSHEHNVGRGWFGPFKGSRKNK